MYVAAMIDRFLRFQMASKVKSTQMKVNW